MSAVMEAGKTLAMGQDEATGSGRAEVDAPALAARVADLYFAKR